MNDNTSIVNIGELSKPATVLIEKISGALGGIFQPWQIRRVAEAEADAMRIKVAAQIEITDLQHRALKRFISEEASKQYNIESITANSLPLIEENAQPQNIEDDWITNFFDKSRLISDADMQLLWSKVLAGEANLPGTYSKRTVNFLGSLDKSDAFLFQSLCSFGWILGDVVTLIYDFHADIYNQHGITFNSLKHLDEIGLLSFSGIVEYSREQLPKTVRITYYGTPIDITFENERNNKLNIGKAWLSKVGKELAPICGSTSLPAFLNYILEKWVEEMGLVISSPIRNDREQQPYSK